MSPYPDNHFFRQFDNYEEGQCRFEAAARHAAHLLNALNASRKEEAQVLTQILNALENGVPNVVIALAINALLNIKYDREYEPSMSLIWDGDD